MALPAQRSGSISVVNATNVNIGEGPVAGSVGIEGGVVSGVIKTHVSGRSFGLEPR